MNFNILLLAASSMFMLIFSCNSPLQKAEKVFSRGWYLQDSLYFVSPPLQSGKKYQLKLDMELTEDYPFRNIYFQVGIAPQGSLLQYSVGRFEVSDESGYWYENPDGKKHNFEWVVLDSLTAKKVASYQFSLKQYMRVDTLQGVSLAKFYIQEM